MATIEIDDDEIIDAIIANPELIARAIERMKECNYSLKRHADRQTEHVQRLASARRRQEPFECPSCGAKTPVLADGVCNKCFAQGMALSENSRSEVEAAGRQPGPATQDAPE